jgi:hypothetical protein
MFHKLCWGTSRFSVCASVRPFVRSFVHSFVRPSHFRFTLALKLLFYEDVVHMYIMM